MSDTIPTSLPAFGAAQRDEQELRAARFAMRMSLAVGVVMLLGKTTAYYYTGSAAILSRFRNFAPGLDSIHVSFV